MSDEDYQETKPQEPAVKPDLPDHLATGNCTVQDENSVLTVGSYEHDVEELGHYVKCQELRAAYASMGDAPGNTVYHAPPCLANGEPRNVGANVRGDMLNNYRTRASFSGCGALEAALIFCSEAGIHKGTIGHIGACFCSVHPDATIDKPEDGEEE